MTRRKGEITDRHRDLSHPFQVAVEVPDAGLHGGAAIMFRWVAWFDHATTRSGRRMHWCFSRREVADAFAMDCGGERIDRPINRHRLALDQPSCKEITRRVQGSLFAVEIVTGGKPIDTLGRLREAARMPFSCFSDPADIARAQGALDKAWAQVAATIPDDNQALERARMAYLVASYALAVSDEDELARRAVERFRQS